MLATTISCSLKCPLLPSSADFISSTQSLQCLTKKRQYVRRAGSGMISAKFDLKPPPYPMDALEPHMSSQTFEYHWGKHHRAYVDNLNKQIVGTELDNCSLEEIVLATYNNGDLLPPFNNAAQAWNHAFFWESMKPGGGGEPSGELLDLINRDFGSFEAFVKEFKAAAATQFASGWAWLAYKANKLNVGNAVNPRPSDEDRKLVVVKTPNAVNPLVWDYYPLLTIDVWEHAYYLDFQGGYRHIDCATIYENEKEIGIAFKKLFEDGEVKREDLFITSKLWLTDFAPEDVPVALDQTLQDLQLDYVDLYLVHWPVRKVKGSVGKDPETLLPLDISSTWKAMETLFDSGKARAIGVCNFSTKKMGDLLNIARVPPAVNQVECHPSWQQQKLHDFCKTKGVHLSGYSPLGSPGKTHLKSVVIKHPIIALIAEKLAKTPAQICLRWGLQMGHSVLPKSTTAARIKENLEVFHWSIPNDLFAKFSEIQQSRLITGTEFVHEKYGDYRTLEDLWDGEI